MKKILFSILIIFILFFVYFVFFYNSENIQKINLSQTAKNIMVQYLHDGKFGEFDTNFDKSSIDLSEILSGGPGKDGIPALSQASFVNIEEAQVDDDVLGVLVEIDGQKRYYPYNILVWHEIVNDSIGDKNFAVTFCPLCGTAIVFDRQVDGQILDFGVSGLLYESNLLMYDRQTESLWSQAGLEAVVGDYTGTELKVLRMQLIPFSKVKKDYPDSKILSRDTNYEFDYDFYPYRRYNESDELYFPVSVNDMKFKPKELMFVVPYSGLSVAFPYKHLEDGQKKVLQIEDKRLEAFKNDDIVVVTIDGQEQPFYYEMWFSWATQHQEDGIVWDL